MKLKKWKTKAAEAVDGSAWQAFEVLVVAKALLAALSQASAPLLLPRRWLLRPNPTHCCLRPRRCVQEAAVKVARRLRVTAELRCATV